MGETEDISQKAAPAGEDGTLDLQKGFIPTAEPTEWIDCVTYEIRLRHVGGSQPVQAQIRDELPYPLIVYPTINGGAIEYVTVASPTGGAPPLEAALLGLTESSGKYHQPTSTPSYPRRPAGW